MQVPTSLGSSKLSFIYWGLIKSCWSESWTISEKSTKMAGKLLLL